MVLLKTEKLLTSKNGSQHIGKWFIKTFVCGASIRLRNLHDFEKGKIKAKSFRNRVVLSKDVKKYHGWTKSRTRWCREKQHHKHH